MIQYMRLKHTKHTGNTILEYLSISDGVMPNNLLMSCGGDGKSEVSMAGWMEGDVEKDRDISNGL